MTNFDITPNRRKTTNITKWTWYPKDILPMWVADMDFPSPPAIQKALHKFVDYAVFGYQFAGTSFKETIADRMDFLYGWKVKPDAVTVTPGIVSAYTVAAHEFGTKKRGVLIQTPVYNEFHEVRTTAGIPQYNAPLAKSVRGNIIKYEIDWDVFEKQVRKAGIFLLCNPHNPLGIIYSRSELARMAELCLKHDVLIISDEIHSELLLGGKRFAPMAKLSSEIAKRTITLVAPSKTYNVPGLFCGFAIIPDKEIRERYVKMNEKMRMHVSSMGLHAAKTAFSGQCDGWLADLRRYLTANRDFLVDYVTRYMPGVRTTIPDATYLGWLDFTQTGIDGSPFEFFKKHAKVALSEGKIFGKEGEGHARINFGTSRAILKQGLDKMRSALSEL